MTGSADRIIKLLHDAGIETICFEGVLPDAPDFLVNEVGILANESDINIIIGIGGGSTFIYNHLINHRRWSKKLFLRSSLHSQ